MIYKKNNIYINQNKLQLVVHPGINNRLNYKINYISHSSPNQPLAQKPSLQQLYETIPQIEPFEL